MSYCCECDAEGIKENLNKLLRACKDNEKLLRAYMLDFFVDNHWGTLPQKWTEVLGILTPEELGSWILYPEPYKYKEVWPLSLLALRSVVQYHSIERQPAREHWRNHALAFSKDCSHRNFLNSDLGRGELKCKLFSKHIKPKKFHEIEIMAKVTANCAKKQGCRFVVDIGSGLGHLGRILAFHYGLEVCCIEEQSCLTEKAKNIDEQLMNFLKKTGQHVAPVHINKSISTALDQNELIQILLGAFGLQSKGDLKFGIVGLHPCGDLGPTLMRLLVNCPNAVFINVVGCCYMKLTEESPGHIQGYPMSYFATDEITNKNLSYEAREVSCHALEMYCDRLKKGSVDDLKIHCFRSTLECIIIRHWPHLKHSGLKSIKHAQDMSFEKYALEAVEKLGITLPVNELKADDVEKYLSQWKNVVVFYSLRLMLAPLVESVILMDRLLYMGESGLPSMLIPAFDPQFSPRNHILVALKEDK